MDDAAPPTRDGLNALLRYLPVFEREGFSAGKVVTGRRDGMLIMPFMAYDEAVSAFVRDAYEHGFVISFDWPSWDEGRRLVDDPDTLARADLLTLRKLITAHLRQDRFSEGHLAEVIESGHMAAILRRLAEIRAALA